MARQTWAQDAAIDDAGAHKLSRSHTQRQRRRGRRGRGIFRGHGGHGLGRGLLGGGLLSGLFGLLSGLLGLFKKHSAHRGAVGRHRKPRKGKILRARAQRGIARPPAARTAGPATPGGRTEVNFYRNGRLRTVTGPFRMRLP